jgi:hypothetical protein
MALSCPKCRRIVNPRPEMAGATIACAGCGQSIAVPSDYAAAQEEVLQSCPLCGAQLRLVPQLNGKKVRCVRCAAVLRVSTDPWTLSVVNGPPAALASGAPAESPPDRPGVASMPPLSRLPAGMPPVPDGVPPGNGAPGRPSSDKRFHLTDMFLGKEKERVFPLLPDEKRLDELTIEHYHFFVVLGGVTRVTLTTQRLLCTVTRVFSPVYWLLLVLFPPLIFYYVARLSRNRNVAFPLRSIDSVEKRYRPNWLIFVVAIVVGFILASLIGGAVAAVCGSSGQHARIEDTAASFLLGHLVVWIVLALLGPIILAVLLATRSAGIEIRTHSGNRFPIVYGPEDRGVSEDRIDGFLRSVHQEMERGWAPDAASLAT